VLVTVFQISHKNLCEDDNDVIHVSARGSHDAIHYIYSSYALPSVLIVRTDTESRLTFNCTLFHSQSAQLQSASVSFSHEPDAVMVLVFSRVCLILVSFLAFANLFLVFCTIIIYMTFLICIIRGSFHK